MSKPSRHLVACLIGSIAALALAAGAAIADDWLEQPTSIPGNWELKDDPLPPLADILDRPRAQVPVYGLYTWGGEYRGHRQSINEVGFTTIRVSGPMQDDTMLALAEDGPDVLFTLQHGRRNQFASDEAFLAAYHDHVTTTLQRYGPGGSFFDEHPDAPYRPITQFNIWNEPNFHYMIPNDPDRTRQELEAQREALYATLLPATYNLIKSDWPDVTVVGFSAGAAAAAERRFIRNVHELNEDVAEAYDVVSWQPYVHPAPPEAHSIQGWGTYSIAQGVDINRRTLAEFGREDTPIWFTEIGWPVSHEDGGHFPTSGSDFATPELQAAYVTRLYALAMRLGVERVHIMFATDTDGFNGGFFLRDGSWRPSAYVAQNMINLMPQPRLIDALSDGEDGYYAYLFSPDAQGGDPVLMAWNVAGPRTVQIELEGLDEVIVYDMLGNEKILSVSDGVLELEIGPYPVYTPIPEPGTLSLLGLVAPIVLSRRARR